MANQNSDQVTPVVKKIRRKRTKVVTDDTILKQIEILRGENKKKASKVKRTILKSASLERLASFGVTPEEIASITTNITRSFLYGTLGKLYSGEDKVEVGSGIAAYPHARDMRAGNEYYNRIVRSVRPLLAAWNLLVDGPAQKELRDIEEKISVEYAAIREINQRAKKRVESEEVTAHLETIKKLKTTRNPLYSAVRVERAQKSKDLVEEKEALNQSITDAIRINRNNRPGGIWHGQYCAIENAFTLARKKAIEEGITPHFRNEWKGEADNFLTNSRWNGEGIISVNLSGCASLGPRKWSDILAGSNQGLKVRKLLPSDFESVGLSKNFRIKDGWYFVSLRRGFGHDISYVSAAVNLHRQPESDSSVNIAAFQTKKIGLKHVTNLRLVCGLAANEPKGEKSAWVLPVWDKQEDQNIISAQWSSGENSGTLVLPSSIGQGLEYSKGLDKVVSKQVGAFNTIRKAFGLETESRSTLRYIGRPDNPILHPKPTTDIYNALSLVSSEYRKMEEEHGHFSGGGEHAGEDLAEAIYLKLKQFFDFEDKSQGLNFTTAWMFRQKYQHLYPWAVNEREGSLLYRREVYRVFAKTLLTGVKELHIPNTDYRNRNMKDEQKLTAPSEFLGILTNIAQREGVEIIPENEEDVVANLKLTSKT
jgi:hypothetical protein